LKSAAPSAQRLEALNPTSLNSSEVFRFASIGFFRVVAPFVASLLTVAYRQSFYDFEPRANADSYDFSKNDAHCRGAIKRRQVCASKRRIKLYAYCLR